MTKLKNLPTWDLTHFYPAMDSPEVKKDISDIADRARRFQKIFQSQLSEFDGDLLASAIREYEDISATLGKLSSYSYLIYAENISDNKHASFYQNTSEKINDIYSNLLFFELEINKITDADIKEKLSQSKDLQHYAPWIRDVRVMRDHQLSDDLEKLLHEKSVTASSSWHRLFEETIADLRFEFGGKKLTSAEIFNLMSSNDAEKRKKAAKEIGRVFGNNIKTFTLITNVLAKDKEINDKWRGLARPITSRNISNLIEDEVTESLIKTVKDNYSNTAHRYYKIKAKWMGKKSLNYWDRNAPLPGDKNKVTPWGKAVEIVLNAYEDFSPEMAKIGKRFFDEKWIDAPARAGKDSGAFSHPTVGSVHPYILMNYQGKTRDIMTLAHELGHGVHQVLSSHQGDLMSDTPLTLAETASVFGEQLTFRSLLKNEKDEKQRKIMIANKVEDMLNTVVRQTAFCDFETRVHAKRREGELSSEDIGKIWMDVQGESLGTAIKFSPEYANYWSYIPHFIHTPFYVYAYAFGDCLVNSLYRVYETSPDGFVDKYIEMLKAGGTLRHKELLEPFGLYAGDPKFWQGGLDIISGFIDELE